MIKRQLITRFLDMFVRFGLILVLVSFCLTVFSPLIDMMLWALILAVALYPLHRHFVGLLAGRQGLTSMVLVLLGILLIVTPAVLMITSLAESASVMIDKVGSQGFTAPPSSSRIVALPITDERLSALWMRASADLPGLLGNYHSQTGDIVKQFLSILANMGGGLIGFIISFVVSEIMVAWGATGIVSVQRIAIRITDENKGVTLTRPHTGAIHAVTQGVIGAALIQALLVGVIMPMTSILATGIFFILALILGIAQMPAILVTTPAIALIWGLDTYSIDMDIFYIILVIVTGMTDNVLKPLLLGRRIDAPIPVVLLGALGGVTSNGIFGMFPDVILLTIGCRILVTWVNGG